MRKLITLLLFAGLFITVLAKEVIPPAPKPARLVNDLAGVLSRPQVDALEQRLVAFNNETSNLICVVTVDDLGGYAAKDFAYEIGDRWGVKSSGKDNGIVILVKPRTHTAGEVYIAVGYDLEGALPDATAKRIIDEMMIPELQKGNYGIAIENAVNQIIPIVKGEISIPRSEMDRAAKSDEVAGFVGMGILVFGGIVGLFLLWREGRRNRLIRKAVNAGKVLGKDFEKLLKKTGLERNVLIARLRIKINQKVDQLIAEVVEDAKVTEEEKQHLAQNMEKLGVSASVYLPQLQYELKEKMLAFLCDDAVDKGQLTSEERQLLIQRGVSMGLSRQDIEKKLDALITENITYLIEESTYGYNISDKERDELYKKAAALGVSFAAFMVIYNEVMKRRRATQFGGVSGQSRGFVGGIPGGFGGYHGGGGFGGLGGFGGAGGFGGGGAGGRF